MARTWTNLLDETKGTVESLNWHQFIVLDYDRDRLGDDAPYAQAACQPGGWYAEIASAETIPRWPEHPQWLHANGWKSPEPGGNWHRDEGRSADLHRLLVSGLEMGRGCLLVDLVTTRVGRFELPPNGGQPTSRRALAA